MKIVVVHNFYRSAQPSGEDSVVRQDLELLQAAGHEVILFSRHSDDIATFRNVAKALLPLKVIYAVDVRRELARVLREEQADLVHVHNTFPLISVAALDAARAAGVPVVMTLHNYRMYCASGTFLREGQVCTACLGPAGPLPAMKYGCYRDSRVATAPLMLSIAANRTLHSWQRGVQRFIVMSDFARQLFSSHGLDQDAITVKAHFVPEAQARSCADEHCPSVYLGRLSGEKGPDVLLEAWQDSFGPLTMIGDGSMRAELEARVAARGLSSVTFRGAMPREEAMRELGRARLMINPSRVFETFGLSVVEGFAHGIGAIIPDQGVFPELAGHDGAAVTFRAGDAASLRSVLGEVLGTPGRTQSMGAAALSRFRECYSAAGNLNQLEDIYAEVLSGR